jgi:rare lipoprotein A
MVGDASWYGGKFHGRTTANGETYDMDGLTAAHRSLPFGSRVRVTNQATNESVIVRINDRGPFVGNRVIDLSRAAAKAVRLIGPGVAPVRLEVLASAG